MATAISFYVPAVFQARTINRAPGGRTFNPPGSAYHQVALRMRAAFEAVRAAKILAAPPATHAITLQMRAATCNIMLHRCIITSAHLSFVA